MMQNFFTFAGDCSTEVTFLLWCLNWYDPLKPRNKLFYMAKDLITFMGEERLSDNQKIDIFRMDGLLGDYNVCVSLRGLNRVLVIGYTVGCMTYDEEHESYRKQVLDFKKYLKIDESVTIRTVLFHTYYCVDSYDEVMVDCRLDKASLLSVLEKYENINRSLDIYIESLRDRILLDEEERNYTNTMPLESPLDWNISNKRIAQHNFMRDMFREHYPKTLWEQESDLYKIQQGNDSGGNYPWSEFPFSKGNYPDSKINYCLCWHLEADENSPNISLQVHEWFDGEDAVCFCKVDQMWKQIIKGFLLQYWELRLDWTKQKRDFDKVDADDYVSLGERKCVILSVSLEKSLKHWETEADLLKQDLLLITDYFLKRCQKQ